MRVQFGCALLLLLATDAEANPIALKCTTSSGLPAADLVVDLEAKQMTWAASTYRITDISERYISAYLETPPNYVGGEVWVLDRISGDYKRAAIAMFLRSKNSPLSSAKLGAAVNTGRCNARIL
jgi:hypothetical protein